MKSLRLIRSFDQDLMSVQDNVKDFSDQFLSLPLLDSVFLEEIQLTTGQDNLVDHKLGNRRARGFVVARRNANSVIYEDTSPIPERFLNLQCSANVTVSLFVF